MAYPSSASRALLLLTFATLLLTAQTKPTLPDVVAGQKAAAEQVKEAADLAKEAADKARSDAVQAKADAVQAKSDAAKAQTAARAAMLRGEQQAVEAYKRLLADKTRFDLVEEGLRKVQEDRAREVAKAEADRAIQAQRDQSFRDDVKKYFLVSGIGVLGSLLTAFLIWIAVTIRKRREERLQIKNDRARELVLDAHHEKEEKKFEELTNGIHHVTKLVDGNITVLMRSELSASEGQLYALKALALEQKLHGTASIETEDSIKMLESRVKDREVKLATRVASEKQHEG